jgi:16S rRNA (cytosine967-C5)-methyltransferase
LNHLGASVRASAARVITQVLAQGRSLKAELGLARNDFDDTRDKALLEAICLAVIRHRRSLEFALNKFLQKSLQRQDPLCHSVILVGLAQLHLLKLSEHAAVSATVEAARLLGKQSRAALVNAVLRRSLREGLAVSADFGIANNHPDWLVKQLQTDWPENWQAIIEANNQQAPLWLRVNGKQLTRAKYAELLIENGIAFTVSELFEQALSIDQSCSPTRLPGWQEGMIAVQDLSAQLTAIALNVKPGMDVLDMCAAPGGKSAQLAEVDGVHLVLLDKEEVRLKKVHDLFERLQLDTTHIQTLAADTCLALPEQIPQLYDAILLDAPCSATGIIRRQPDVKWHRQAKDIDQLNTLQWRLLKNAWHYLKPGGRLLYSTCSVLKAENEFLIASFLKQHSDARAIALDARFGIASGAGWQRFPGEEDGDGFYYALLQKA